MKVLADGCGNNFLGVKVVFNAAKRGFQPSKALDVKLKYPQ